MFKKMITRAIAVTLALPILIATPLRASAADAIPDNSEWNAFVEEKNRERRSARTRRYSGKRL